MADPTVKTFRQLVQQGAAAVQSRASGLVDFSVGSVTRAIIQAVAGVALWLQALILALLASTRASTSSGADLDTFVADFGGPFVEGGVADIQRLGAAPAVGLVTFTRLTPQGTAAIPVGATVETRDGRQRFAVQADTGNGTYDPAQRAYIMNPGVAEVTVPVATSQVGSAGNVLAGAVSVITSPIPGVDLVENEADFINGQDAESDEAFRARFRAYVASLREATRPAILRFVTSLQPGIRAVLVEGQELDGTPRPGFFYVVVDDGTGDPPQTLIDGAAAVVREHRAAGTEGAVLAPVVVPLVVTFDITADATAHQAEDIALAEAAVARLINTRQMGERLPRTRLYSAAYAAADTIRDVDNLLINGLAADIEVEPWQVVKADTVTGSLV